MTSGINDGEFINEDLHDNIGNGDLPITQATEDGKEPTFNTENLLSIETAELLLAITNHLSVLSEKDKASFLGISLSKNDSRISEINNLLNEHLEIIVNKSSIDTLLTNIDSRRFTSSLKPLLKNKLKALETNEAREALGNLTDYITRADFIKIASSKLHSENIEFVIDEALRIIEEVEKGEIRKFKSNEDYQRLFDNALNNENLSKLTRAKLALFIGYFEQPVDQNIEAIEIIVKGLQLNFFEKAARMWRSIRRLISKKGKVPKENDEEVIQRITVALLTTCSAPKTDNQTAAAVVSLARQNHPEFKNLISLVIKSLAGNGNLVAKYFANELETSETPN